MLPKYQVLINLSTAQIMHIDCNKELYMKNVVSQYIADEPV